MTAHQTTLDLADDAAGQSLAAMPGSPWVEKWENFDLTFADVPPEHRIAWITETSNWLHAGRRWPMNPTDSMIAHCQHWWVPVAKMMREHGWWFELSDWNQPGSPEPIGYVITWKHRNDGIYQLSQGGCQAHYAGIIGAAIVRRKARYYGIWKKENGGGEVGPPEEGPLSTTLLPGRDRTI